MPEIYLPPTDRIEPGMLTAVETAEGLVRFILIEAFEIVGGKHISLGKRWERAKGK